MNSTIHNHDRTRRHVGDDEAAMTGRRKRPKTAPTTKTDHDQQHPHQPDRTRNWKEATTTTNPAPPQDPDGPDPPPSPSYYYPRSIVTWNCNGTGRVMALLFFWSFSSSILPLSSQRLAHSLAHS